MLNTVVGEPGCDKSDPYTVVVNGFLDVGHDRYYYEIRPLHETMFTTSV